ncbi:MAG: hypothetical protein LBP65_03305 [Puniceicoccales bacterium]|nr:hypothetical protein [Puniceicoccales bacterium]
MEISPRHPRNNPCHGLMIRTRRCGVAIRCGMGVAGLSCGAVMNVFGCLWKNVWLTMGGSSLATAGCIALWQGLRIFATRTVPSQQNLGRSSPMSARLLEVQDFSQNETVPTLQDHAMAPN